jgi:hypothetical protein
MYSQILVPLDGSENSEGALPHAQELARISGATLHLIQVFSHSEELDMARGGGYDFLAAEYSQDLAQEYIAAPLNRAGEYLKEAAMWLDAWGIKAETAQRGGRRRKYHPVCPGEWHRPHYHGHARPGRNPAVPIGEHYRLGTTYRSFARAGRSP